MGIFNTDNIQEYKKDYQYEWGKKQAEIQSSALDHFSNLLGEPVFLNKFYKAPYRQDTHPSLKIFFSKKNNIIMFKDHATGLTGCVIQLYAITHHWSYKRATEHLHNKNVPALSENKAKYLSKIIRGKKVVEIGVKRLEWNLTRCEYWNRYLIPLSILREYLVFPIEYCLINDKVRIKSEFPDNPSYVYRIFNSIKIYSPYREKNLKWKGNCTSMDIQGWQQLDMDRKDLIITKSLKDVMAMRMCGFNAIAPACETIIIPDLVVEAIKNSFKKIVVFYDNDEAGIEGSKKTASLFPSAQEIRLPNNDKRIKDFSDGIKRLGISPMREWLRLKVQ